MRPFYLLFLFTFHFLLCMRVNSPFDKLESNKHSLWRSLCCIMGREPKRSWRTPIIKMHFQLFAVNELSTKFDYELWRDQRTPRRKLFDFYLFIYCFQVFSVVSQTTKAKKMIGTKTWSCCAHNSNWLSSTLVAITLCSLLSCARNISLRFYENQAQYSLVMMQSVPAPRRAGTWNSFHQNVWNLCQKFARNATLHLLRCINLHRDIWGILHILWLKENIQCRAGSYTMHNCTPSAITHRNCVEQSTHGSVSQPLD